MKKTLMAMAASFVTFTRIPIAWQLDDESFKNASWHLPLVAWAHFLFLALLLTSLPMPHDLKIFLCIALPIIIGGGMHEDGLADSADALFGAQSLEKRLAIMKDSNVGSFALLAVVLNVLGTYLALKNIPETKLLLTLAFVFPVSRFLAPCLAAILPYVRGETLTSKAKAYLNPDRRGLIWSFVWLTPLAIVWKKEWLIASASALALFPLLVLFFKKKLGGITGDGLGASIKSVELLLLWTFAWIYA